MTLFFFEALIVEAYFKYISELLKATTEMFSQLKQSLFGLSNNVSAPNNSDEAPADDIPSGDENSSSQCRRLEATSQSLAIQVEDREDAARVDMMAQLQSTQRGSLNPGSSGDQPGMLPAPTCPTLCLSSPALVTTRSATAVPTQCSTSGA